MSNAPKSRSILRRLEELEPLEEVYVPLPPPPQALPYNPWDLGRDLEQEQEALKQLHAKLSDQLQRLQSEELVLKKMVGRKADQIESQYSQGTSTMYFIPAPTTTPASSSSFLSSSFPSSSFPSSSLSSSGVSTSLPAPIFAHSQLSSSSSSSSAPSSSVRNTTLSLVYEEEQEEDEAGESLREILSKELGADYALLHTEEIEEDYDLEEET